MKRVSCRNLKVQPIHILPLYALRIHSYRLHHLMIRRQSRIIQISLPLLSLSALYQLLGQR